MSCCKNFTRFLIGFLNLAVIVCAVIAGVYIYIHERGKNWAELVKNNVPFIILLVCMAFAIVSALIGLFLCCCKSKCLNVTYLIIILLVIIIEIVCIVLAFVYKDNIMNGIGENWLKDDLKKTRHEIESEFKCCGFNEQYTDPIGDCGYPDYIVGITPYCYEAIKADIDGNFKNLKIGIIVMTALELVLLICAFVVVCIKSGKNENGGGISKF